MPFTEQFDFVTDANDYLEAGGRTTKILFTLHADEEFEIQFIGVDTEYWIPPTTYWGFFDGRGDLPGLNRLAPTDLSRRGAVDAPIRANGAICRGLLGVFGYPQNAQFPSDQNHLRVSGVLRTPTEIANLMPPPRPAGFLATVAQRLLLPRF